MTEKRQRNWFYILMIGLAAYTVKNLLVGADADEGYGMVLGYRLAKGDRLIQEMWEPHQTSAIFTALLIRPFLWIGGGNNDFLNLYLRVAYFALHGGLVLFCYGTLKKCVPGLGKTEAALCAGILYVTSPKAIYIPEYSNLHVWFFALLCLCLMRYYCAMSPQRGKMGVLGAAGLWLCCDALAYPSMVLLFPICVVFIFCHGRASGAAKRREALKSGETGRLKRDIKKPLTECLVFAFPCLAALLGFAGYVRSYMTVPQMMQVLPYILGDGTHQTTPLQKTGVWLESYGEILLMLAVGGMLALAAAYGRRALTLLRNHGGEREKENDFTVSFLFFFFVSLLAWQIYCWFFSDFNPGYPQILYTAICLMGIFCHCRSQRAEKAGFYLILFSYANYFAVSLLSNWEPVHLHPYLCMGAMGGILCMRAYFQERGKTEEGKKLLRAMCGLFILGNVFGYCYLIIGGEQLHSNIFTVRGINYEGARKGILVPYMSAYRYNTNLEAWREAVPKGSTVLYLGPAQYAYLLGDCVIAAPSTISTPTYDESMLTYWELNPERRPDVVVVESCFGEIRIFQEESFMGRWLEEYCGDWFMEDYPYIRVYRKGR